MQYSQKPTSRRTARSDARSDQRIGERPVKPSSHSPRLLQPRGWSSRRDRPSLGRRIFRALTRFFYAVSHRCWRHACLAVPRRYGKRDNDSPGRQLWPVVIGFDDKAASCGCNFSWNPCGSLSPWRPILDVVRRSVEELAAKQDQMARTLRHCRLSMRTSDRRCHPRLCPRPSRRLDPAA